MKKLCLLLLLFSFVSVIPSFAAKIIVNDDTDRRVLSRSSGPEAFVQYYEVGDNYVEEKVEKVETKVDEKVVEEEVATPSPSKGYQLEKYKTENLPLLQDDFRLELIGTSWDYSAYEELERQAELEKAATEEIVKEEVAKEEIVKEEAVQEMIIPKRKLHREAADYYTKDTLKNPDVLIPCGDLHEKL